jgi:hypothetical protein
VAAENDASAAAGATVSSMTAARRTAMSFAFSGLSPPPVACFYAMLEHSNGCKTVLTRI